MSFFGFDTTLPKGAGRPGASQGIFEHRDPFAEVSRAHKLQAFQDSQDQPLEFDDTYDGLGDQLDETGDDLNDDTFGGGFGDGPVQQKVGKDFDFFGQTAKVSDVIGQEQVRYNLNHAPTNEREQPNFQPAPQKPRKTGYERYQDPGFIPEISAKSSVWGNAASRQVSSTPLTLAQQASATQKKMMSLEEVEAAMRAQNLPHMPTQPPPQAYPTPFPQPEQYSQYPPQNFPQPRQPQMQLPQQIRPPPPPQPAQDLAKRLQAPQLLQRQQQGPPQPQANHGPQKPLQILQNPNRTPPAQSATGKGSGASGAPAAAAALPVITNPHQLMQLSEDQRRAYLEEDAKRAKRNHKIFLLSRGNGLMTPQDKNFITRIQLQQLVTATGTTTDPDPEAALAEDFYYQVHSQIRGAPRQHPTQPLGHFAQTYLFQTGSRSGGHRRQQINGDNHMQRMQQQVQRAVEAAKLKPKNKQLIIEGSLGKISFSNAKTPKPLLNIKRAEVTDQARPSSAKRHGTEQSRTDQKAILRNIENVYSTLMKMEDQERRMPPPPNDSDAGTIQAHMEWRQTMSELNEKLWNDLKVLEPIMPGSAITHPFIAFLSHSKGKKAVPRIFRHIDQEQRVTILTMIVVHLDQLDVVGRAQIAPGETQPSPVIREEVELFSNVVMPSLLGYITEAPINIVIGLMGLVLDHTNVIGVSRTKVGLGILTMLLSRAELLKEGGAANDQDWSQWQQLYNRLFDTLEPFMTTVFPGPVNAGDDMYIWQFLAAVGIGASPEQQQRLVIAVK
ncbi:putative topisomerase ii associated protein [Phaeomoniella chlamydospora]|uniref:Putative topisomerase ii associated protein n=1 Tax=Phaeomoniella chlamydospora TaxID=158046 RepID=A0A0G2DZN9_PHACM|nr:putative topisomerase ii associated protein [Phaeomoniella chlamydospora]